MCGIAGFVNKNWGKEQLSVLGKILHHRGPEDEGFFQFENCGLVHRRLRIIDLDPRASQPMQTPDGRFVIVFNGEIYNYQTIAQSLDYAWRTKSDTEVLLAAFAQKGKDAVHTLNGMFAFAIVDTWERRLYLYRDRLGIKPLVYYWDGQVLAFASELKALLALGLKHTLNQQALQDYLFLEYIPGENLIFDNFYRLPAGNFIELDIQTLQFQLHCYYDIVKFATPRPCNESLALQNFSAELQRAVNAQRVSDVPIGAFLSGGADSSAVVAAFDTPPQTFTIGFEEKNYDESSYATQVAQALGVPNSLTRLPASNALTLLSTMVAQYDLPFAVSSALPTLLVCQKARAQVTVALSGDGGDELFMGYGYYFWYNRIAKIVGTFGRNGARLISLLLKNGNTRQQRAARVFDLPPTPPYWPHIWSQEQYMFTEAEIALLTGKPYRHLTLRNTWKRLETLDLHPYEKISLVDLLHYLPDNLLYKVDIASMTYALEVRVPLLDHKLVELVLQLPYQLKVNQNTQKYLLKKYLSQHLPKSLVYRKKWGFPAPVSDWLKTSLKPLLHQTLSDKQLKENGIFNYSYVKNLIQDFENGAHYHYKRLWALIVFELWRQKFGL